MEEVHCLHALDGLDVLVSLEEELVDLDEQLVELDDAHVIDKSFLELHREALVVAHELVGLGWLRHDLNQEGHVAPQVLELHVVVVLDVVHLDVVTLAPLVLVVVLVNFLVLA